MTATASNTSTAALHEALGRARQYQVKAATQLQQSKRTVEHSKTMFKRLRTELRAADRLIDLAAYELVDLEHYEETTENEGGTSAQWGKIRERKQRIQQRIVAGAERYSRVLATLGIDDTPPLSDIKDTPPPPEPPEPARPAPPGPPGPPEAQQSAEDEL